MKRALVTGATGYVGSNLVKGLIRGGWAVSVITRPDSSMKLLSRVSDKVNVFKVTGSAHCIQDIVGKAKPDVVFHIASMVVNEHKPDEVASLIGSNITFGTELLEAMVFHGVSRFANTGTYWEHYQNKDYSPVNLYAATKRAFQDLLQYYVEAKGIKTITLKLFDTYGQNDPRPKLLNLLMKIAETGETLAMSLGEQKIDLVHIDDVVSAYLLAAERLLGNKVDRHEIYGISTGKPMSIKDLVNQVEQVTGKKLHIEWGGRPYRDREMMDIWQGDSNILNQEDTIKIEQGICSLIKDDCMKEKGHK
ncbi:MAG: NAD(P)-dependent oxidoreductase [Ghiorsea sp.]|nr:NAD(P)-dependent oxidoreductase [Ghiorsea sp.]